MNSNRRPIGVFDSGAGGLTVVRTVRERLPNERVVYFGDTAYVPYGPRPAEEIRRFAADAARFLCSQGAKVIVMGCNMSSAMALETTRAAVPCSVLATVSAGARMAVAVSLTGRIGVAATEGTVRSRAYERAVKALRPDAEVIQRACPLLVPAVEAGLQDGQLEEAVAESLGPLREARPDTVILGCTHYPLLQPQIAAYLGSDIGLVDPAESLAVETEEVLMREGLLSDQPPAQPVVAFASGPAGSLTNWAAKALGIDLGEIRAVDVHRAYRQPGT